ncbi:MAG: DUF3822 family protein [Bacteroides sp.]|jgi:hypothetical protein|nr:DUF3822 family protein [Bacteroides sp.]
MSGPFRKTVSIVDKDFLPGSERNEILSIELSLDGFSFAILDPRHFKYLMLESYRFDPGSSQDDFPEQLENFIRDYPLLLGSFERISIAWYQPQYTLIPADLFLYAGKDDYHQFTGDFPQGYELKADKLNNLGAYGIYPFPETIRKRLEFLYPAHRIRHTATVFVESLLSSFRLGEVRADLAIYVNQGHFELLLFEGDRLVFYNSFAYQAFDDLMYFLFYVLEQFELDASQVEAILAGDISLDSKEYAYLAQYFKKAGFVSRSDVYKYSPAFDAVPHHGFFNLLHLNTCG